MILPTQQAAWPRSAHVVRHPGTYGQLPSTFHRVVVELRLGLRVGGTHTWRWAHSPRTCERLQRFTRTWSGAVRSTWPTTFPSPPQLEFNPANVIANCRYLQIPLQLRVVFRDELKEEWRPMRVSQTESHCLDWLMWSKLFEPAAKPLVLMTDADTLMQWHRFCHLSSEKT